MQSNPEQETQDLYEFLKDDQFLDGLREKGTLVTGPPLNIRLPQTSKPGFRARSTKGRELTDEERKASRLQLEKIPQRYRTEDVIPYLCRAENARLAREKRRPKKKPEYDPFVSWNPASWVPSPWNPYDYRSEFPDLCSLEFGTPWCCAMAWKIFHWITEEPKSIRKTLKHRFEDYIDLDKLSLSDLCSLHVGGVDLSSVRSKHLFTVDEYDC